MPFFAVEPGLLAEVPHFQIVPQSRITKHERFSAAHTCTSPSGPAR
jgi:hypothetical protein